MVAQMAVHSHHDWKVVISNLARYYEILAQYLRGIYAQSVILHMLPLSYDIKIVIILYQNLSILNAPVEKF